MCPALRERLLVRIGRNLGPARVSWMVDRDDRGRGEGRGYDGGKKVKGRKRHLPVDTQGLVLKVKVRGAAVMDREGIEPTFGARGRTVPSPLSPVAGRGLQPPG
jgi:putative transposase